MGKYFWGDTETELSEEKTAFEEKFRPKKTTDECYTPAEVYEVVLSHVVEKYALGGRQIVRPFYPGGDYEQEEYLDRCVVVDNPPFSKISAIVTFYLERGIDFFLFAPHLTLMSVASGKAKYCVTNAHIVYENGATVATDLVTSLGEYKILTDPALKEKIEAAVKVILGRGDRSLPRYEWPAEVVTGALLGKIAAVDFAVKDAHFIRRLASSKAAGKTLFGSGFLISEKAAAEKAAAEKAAAEKAAAVSRQVWTLSEEERDIVRSLGEEERAWQAGQGKR